MENFHDYMITKYTVDFEKKELQIIVKNGNKNKKIGFNNLFAYEFKDEVPNSIILDIEISTIEKFLLSNKIVLDDRKGSGWPCFYSDFNELIELIKEKHLKYYVLFSSYGMNGWILAESISIE